MNHPQLVNAIAQDRFKEMLHEAEVERRLKKAQGKSENLLAQVGQVLIAAGEKLQTQQPVHPVSFTSQGE